MRLIIDVDKKYKKLFVEVAKVTGAKTQVDERYQAEGEQDATKFPLRIRTTKSDLQKRSEM